jgi:hypothetical protein
VKERPQKGIHNQQKLEAHSAVQHFTTSDSCFSQNTLNYSHKRDKKKHTNAYFTFKPCSRSSLVWAADMQILALASNKGVAGKATTTTATWQVLELKPH